MQGFNNDYRIQILVRHRGESGFESTEIKTEFVDDIDGLEDQVNSFISETLEYLEEERDEDSSTSD